MNHKNGEFEPRVFKIICNCTWKNPFETVADVL